MYVIISVVIIYFSGNYLSYHPDETKRHREEQCTRRSRALGWLMLVSARGLNHDTSPKARGTKRLAPELFIESTNLSPCVVPLKRECHDGLEIKLMPTLT